jgi:hypothetical protein
MLSGQPNSRFGMVSGILFFMTVIAAACVHLRYQYPWYRAARRLDRALRDKGMQSFLRNQALIWRMFRNPEVIFNESDSPEIRALKAEVVHHWRENLTKALPRMICVIVIGITVTALGGVVEHAIRGKE